MCPWSNECRDEKKISKKIDHKIKRFYSTDNNIVETWEQSLSVASHVSLYGLRQ